MNAYEKRKAELAAKSKGRTQRETALRNVQRDRLMQQYEQAFKEYYGKDMKVIFERSRFTVGSARLTWQELEGKLLLLQGKIHEQKMRCPNA